MNSLDFDIMNYLPEPWYGNIEKKTENRTYQDYLDTIEKPPLCMLRHVSEGLLRYINEFRIENPDTPIFVFGQWILTTGSCEEGIIVHPPFNDMQAAMEYARLNLGVNNFYQYPVWTQD